MDGWGGGGAFCDSGRKKRGRRKGKDVFRSGKGESEMIVGAGEQRMEWDGGCDQLMI